MEGERVTSPSNCAEIAQCIVAHHAVIEDEIGRGVLVTHGIDVEMVVPELRHHFAQLRVGMHGADQRGGLNLAGGADALLIGHAALS